MKNETKHKCRRIFLIIIPTVVSVIISLIVCFCMNKNNYVIDANNIIEVIKVLTGVWGTLLGFIITAESILIAFSSGTFTEEFKKTGHYRTVIFQYTQTSIKLLCWIFLFVIVCIIKRVSMKIMFALILALCLTFIDVLLCFIILVLMLKMSNK